MHSPGHVAATDEQAREQLYPHQAELYTRIGRERGWPPYSRIQFEQAASPAGRALRRLARDGRTEDRVGGPHAGLSRFQLKYSVGALPHDQRLESVRLYGEEVVPRVRELLAAS